MYTNTEIRFVHLLAFISILVLNFFSDAFSQHHTPDLLLTEAQYIAALDSANEMTFKRNFEYPFLLFLSEKQNEYYKNLKSIDARKDFIKLYWKKWNPDPLLPENEWLLFFLKRCAYVKKHFSCCQPPYFDDRGKYYLKYGEPFYRYKRLAGSKRVTLFNDRAMHGFVMKLSRDYIFEYYEVLGNESWVYKFSEENMTDEIVIHFVDEGSHFREIERLDQAIIGIRRLKSRMWYWSDMIKERAFMMNSRHLINLTSEILEFEADLRDALELGKDIEGILRSKIQNPDLILFIKKTNNEIEETINKNSLPPAIYASEKLIQDIDFYSDITQFRGPGSTTRVEITILSPVDKNIVERISSSSLDTANIEFKCMVRDAAFNPTATDKMVTKFPLAIATREKLPNAMGYLRLWLSSQQGDITLQVKDLLNDHLGYLKQPLIARNFKGQDLMISDIQFFAEVKNLHFANFLPVIKKQNINVAPYPYQNIRKSIPVLCYFEIYNLITSGITNEFEIAIHVYADESRKSGVKKLSDWVTGKKDVSISTMHSRSVISDVSYELISIDFSSLKNGPYQLEITVTDKNDKSITAQAQKEISIVE